MSFTPRPDSFLVLSGPKPANRKGNTAPSIDSLSGFVSEVQPAAVVTPAIVAPAVVARVRAIAPAVAVPAAPAAPVGSAAATSISPHPSLRQKRTSLAGSVITSPTLAAACSAFIAVAVASAAIITVLGGSDRPSANAPSTNVPPTSQAVTPALPPPTLTGPALPPDPRRAANAVTPDPPPQSSPVVATANRAVGTTGRRTAVPNQAARTSRATAPSYRGSLSIGSAPQGARVFVNGAPVGSTPLVLDNLPVGSRAVRIEADGYQRWSASTRVVANQQTRLSAILARAKP